MAQAVTEDAWWAGTPGIRFTRFMPHVPEPTQHAYLWLDCLEAMFGGAAGGGKSDTLLMAAAQYVDVPNYAALLVRRTYKDLSLPGAIMARSKEWWLNSDASWNDTEKTWTFPSGATITFGYLQRADDVYQYQGAEFQFIGVDEATQIQEFEYRYLRSRLRRPDRKEHPENPLAYVPLRMRSATNPGGKSHKFFKRQFIDKLPDPEDSEDTREKAGKRVYIPSKLKDNPHVDQEAYEEALQGLDPRTRKQLLEGDWSVREPGAWVFDDATLEAAKELGDQMDRLRKAGKIEPVGGALQIGVDFGTHTHVLIGWQMQGGGTYFAKEVKFDGYDVTKAVGPTLAAIRALGYPVSRFRFDASMPGLATTFYDALCKELGYKPKWTAVPFNKFKRLAIQHQNWLLANTAEDRYPQLAISRTGCPEYCDQAERLYYDDPETDRVHKEDDHGPDAGFAFLAPDAKKRDQRVRGQLARA